MEAPLTDVAARVLQAIRERAMDGYTVMQRARVQPQELTTALRELQSRGAVSIKGDLKLKFAWPLPHIQASDVTFSNPSWAREPQMLSTGLVEVRLDLLELLHRRVVFPEVRLVRPTVFLEHGLDGRKSWLLDLDQRDEAARIQIDHLSLDHGTLGYDDAALKTSIRASVGTTAGQGSAASKYGLDFSAAGQFNGIPVKAQGSAGPVLALRNDSTPYALKFDADLGRTHVKAEGSVTNLLKVTAVDMSLALRGDNADQLFPLVGLPMPTTRAYVTNGHLIHNGNVWRYEKFTGRFGDSDIAGTIKVETGGPRPVLVADLSSSLLDIEDLGPLIGARPGSAKAARQAAAVLPAPGTTPARMRVLPDLPFKTDRWDSLDADVNLRAKSIRRARELPLENLNVHLLLHDAVVMLDPLDFGLAGGHLNAVISLDGRKSPIQAHARVKAQKLLLARLFPTVELNKASIGQITSRWYCTGLMFRSAWSICRYCRRRWHLHDWWLQLNDLYCVHEPNCWTPSLERSLEWDNGHANLHYHGDKPPCGY